MDINPLIADLNRYQDELIDSISIAMGFRELNLADIYVANAIAEIKGEVLSKDPFQQVADIYKLPRQEVVNNVRKFTNKCYKILLPGDYRLIKDIEFDNSRKQLT